MATRPGEHFFVDAECGWYSHPYHMETVKLHRSDFAGAAQTGIDIGTSDTLSLAGIVRRSRVAVADSIEPVSFRYRPEAIWHHRFPASSFFDGALELDAGADFFTTDSSGVFAPVWNAVFNASVNKYRCAVFAGQDLRHYAPPVDSLADGTTLHDAYVRAGLHVERTWHRFSLLTGYQWCYGIDTLAAARSWASQTPPYRQPQSVFIVAPALHRWNGIGLSSRFMFSDTRPFIKMQGALSLLVFPKLTNEAFDIRIECNYWSERERIVFAELTDWNRPVVDVNFIATAHIKSFRLVYKIDNLLNREFSYVPGYYAPGITFRWGFSWFIQR